MSVTRLLIFSLMLFTATSLEAVEVKKDVAYDDQHKAQKIDVYLAESEKPMPAMIYIHGGGWQGGSKNRVPKWLQQGAKEGKFSVISVEYRFTQVAPHPAQVNDCIRAVQFVRSKAEEWNIDKKRVGVTGGSAGGHLTLWVALHDDMANPDAVDPVKQESSRVKCAVSFAGPTDWNLLSIFEHAHPAYRSLIGYDPNTPAQNMRNEVLKDVSPITFVSKDDPPVLLIHGDADRIVPVAHAKKMSESLQEAGVESELIVVPGASHAVAGAGMNVTARASEFVEQHLLAP